MLIIRSEQMDTLSQAVQAGFETEMVAHCKGFSPRLCEAIGEAQLRLAICQAIQRAVNYGITNRGPVRSFIEMALMFGSEFDTDPQYPWAGEILNSGEYTLQMERAECLYRKTMDYMEKVIGPEYSFALSALDRVSVFAKQRPPISRQNFVSDMLQEISLIYPEQCAYVGYDAMAMLIREAEQAAGVYGMTGPDDMALLSLMMMALGHGCMNDPLYPWIAKTLGDEAISDASARARSLEIKALAWLDNVIAWHKERVH